MSGDCQVLLQLCRERNHLAHAVERRIAVLLNQKPVCFGDGAQVRRVDNQLAAFLYNSSEFVACFAANPKLVVMLIKQGHNSFVFSAGVLDVNLAADFRGPPE